jgi:hypothetical protein
MAIDLYTLLFIPVIDLGEVELNFNDLAPQMVILPNIRLGYRKTNDNNSSFFRTGVSLS